MESDAFTRLAIEHFTKKKVKYEEDSLIQVIVNPKSSRNDMWLAVHGLYDLGTEKCIPYLMQLKDYPMEDVQGSFLAAIARILRVKGTDYYVNVLQEKGSAVKKMSAMHSIYDYADERAIDAVIEYLNAVYKKIKQPKGRITNIAYLDGLTYLARFFAVDERILDIYDKFLNVKDKLSKQRLMEIPFFIEKLGTEGLIEPTFTSELKGYVYVGRGQTLDESSSWRCLAIKEEYAYRCANCGAVVSATSDKIRCRCGAMGIHPGTERFGSRYGDPNILVYQIDRN